jgi:hypothetical protein
MKKRYSEKFFLNKVIIYYFIDEMYIMKILIDIGHPAHVHLFKNLVWSLKKKGHVVHITARDKEIVLKLLNHYQFDYTLISRSKKGLFNIGKEMIQRDYNLFNLAKKIHPDLMIAVLDPSIAHIGKLLHIPSITLTDTEHATMANILTFPFTDVVFTPSSYRENIGNNQIRYKGCHQLASLHPAYFTPNPAVLTELGLDTSDSIFLIRFAAFKASHDTKSENFDKRYIPDLLKKLEDKGTIVISSELKLDASLQKYEYKLAPEKYHDLLYYAKMYIGEGSTSAMEAAVLGTPAINFERIVSKGKNYSFADFSGVIAEFQDKYDLIHCYYDEVMMLEKIDEIIRTGFDKVKMQAKENKERLLHDTIDVTGFLVWFIENYPESANQMRKNPDIQQRFSYNR